MGACPQGRGPAQAESLPEYGPDFYATYWLDPHGIMLEAVTYAPEEKPVADVR